MDNAGKSPGFTISCENPDFQHKMHDVFAGIDESASNMTSQDSNVGSDGEEGPSTEESCKRSKLSEKKGEYRKPDYLVNPSRYTKYSLKETELSDNKANSQIAFQFLRQLKKSEEPGKSEEISAADDSPFSKKHVFKMPEQTVGTSKEKETKSPTKIIDDISATGPCDKVELDHLEEDVSATEFANEIAMKLDEELAKRPSANITLTESASEGEKFKSIHKRKRNLREKPKDE